MANFHDRWKLEFTEDALSTANADATWVDVTADVRDGSMRWSGGIDRIGDEPQAGQMSFTMKGRDFEPLNSGSTYYPNVRRWARFRLSLDRGSGFESEFVGYARTFQPQWPGGTSYQEVDVVCGDGFDILVKNRLPSLDPPDAEAYSDVVNADDPWGYWRLGDTPGTRLLARLRSKPWRRRHHNATRRQKHYRVAETRSPLEGVSGAGGTYKGLPTLGAPGLILGDADTAVSFDGVNDYARVAVDQADTIDTNSLTVEAWLEVDTDTSMVAVSGPYIAAQTLPAWWLSYSAGLGAFSFKVRFTDGTQGAVTVGAFAISTAYHVVGTWDGNEVRLYVDGVLVGTEANPGKTLQTGDAGEFVRIGVFESSGSLSSYWIGTIDEVAIYEKVLSADRILAHYQAGAERGYAQQSAEDRIEALLIDFTDVPWDTVTYVGPGSFEVLPTMQHGQSRLEEIVRALAAEGVRAQVFFGRDGNPTVLGWEWQSTGAYMTPAATFGAPAEAGEIEFRDDAIAYDDEVYNLLSLSRDGGSAIVLDNDRSIAANGESAAEAITGLANTDDDGVAALGAEFLMLYANPTWTLSTLDLIGSDLNTDALAQLCDRDIGDMVEFLRHAESGPDLHVLTWILGYEKRIESGDVLTGTWKLARGWNAAEGVWLLGITGYSEIGETTVLG